jgi:hypothetical protein
MRYNENKLEKWIEELPECKDFLSNFFVSCGDDSVSELVNYLSDICSYGITNKHIRKNRGSLVLAYEEIAGIKFYLG